MAAMEEAAAAEASARKRKRDEIWKRMSEFAAREPYSYLSISQSLEVRNNNKQKQICLFAVVSEISPAIRSRGTDFYVTLRIVDESCKVGISATFFAESTALLPCVKSTGDVISLHHVEIRRDGELYCVAFVKKCSSFALFESKLSADCNPYQTSVKYRGSRRDKELLTQMRRWLPNNPLGLKDLELPLSGLKSDSTFDLVCKVLHVRENSGKWIFYVWDGTDTPPAEFQATLDAEAVEAPPLLQGPPLPREVFCTMPCVGTVLRIFSDISVPKVSHMQNNIYWARFCNITCKQEFGIWKGIWLASSRVRLLSEKDGSVVDRLKMYDTRKDNKVCRQPMASFPSNVADVIHKKAGYSTLMESLTHHEVTHKLKTVVRVVGAYPCQASELPLLSTGNYCIRLTLEDPTARIHAYVPKDGVVKFFGGIMTPESIIKKMKKLLGIPETEDIEEAAPLTRNPPWIWCCLKSYYLDENDIWGSRRYQIYDTRIRG